MELNLSSRCRACLSENDTMLSLFDIYEHDLTLAMILRSCIANTEVSENDGLPSRICDSCVLVLTQFYNFTVVYEESNKQLRTLLKKGRKAVQVSDDDYKLENDLDVIKEQEESSESETCDLIPPDSTQQLMTGEDLNEIVAVVQIGNDSSAAQENVEFYEFKTDNSFIEHPEIDGSIQEYKMETAVKKEVISVDNLESVMNADDSNEYLEIHVSDTNDIFMQPKVNVCKEEKHLIEEITKYECTICGEAHLYAASFQQHMRVKHRMSDINCKHYASRIQIKVPQIPDTTDKEYGLSEDQIDVNDPPQHKCKFCSKRFYLASQLQHHHKLHESNKKYVCDVCGSRFIRKTYLDDHMEGHSTEKKHVCKFCGKAFRRRTVLRAHKRVHTHPNHYVCELCGRAFTNSSTLKTHKLLIHVKERNFKCLICNLSFPLKSTLNKHVLRHQKRENGEKGFNCPQCEMQYRDKSSLKRHVETKHQGKVQLIACPDCPKKYTSNANLMKHRRKHHGAPLKNQS